MPNFLDIILIGPPFAGKSSLGKLIAEKLAIPNVSYDKLRFNYFKEIGFDEELAGELRAKGGFLSLVAYWSQFNAHAIKRVLEEHANCVFDLGGGPLVFENQLHVAQIQQALEPYQNVIRLLPSPDLQKSIEILRQRGSHLIGVNAQEFDWSSFFVKHAQNQKLAKIEVFTDGKSVEETCYEILELVCER